MACPSPLLSAILGKALRVSHIRQELEWLYLLVWWLQLILLVGAINLMTSWPCVQHHPSCPQFALCVETFIAKFAFVFVFAILGKASEWVTSAKTQSDFISSLVAAINLITSWPCVAPPVPSLRLSLSLQFLENVSSRWKRWSDSYLATLMPDTGASWSAIN